MQSTTNYDQFKTPIGNRELDPGNLKKLRASFSSKNLMHLKPIVVDEDMNVIDGNHRVAVAKELKIPVFYIIQEGNIPEDMLILNIQKQWTSRDAVNFMAKHGNKFYQFILDWDKKINLGVHLTCRLFKKVEFKRGSLKHLLKTSEQTSQVSPEMIERLEKVLPYFSETMEWLDSYFTLQGKKPMSNLVKFRAAFLMVAVHNDIDMPIFMEKIKTRAHLIPRAASLGTYKSLLMDMYNAGKRKKGNSEKVPLDLIKQNLDEKEEAHETFLW